MNVDGGHVYLHLAESALQRLQKLDAELKKHATEQKIAVYLNQSPLQKCAAILDNAINLLEENIHTNNVYGIIDILTDTALHIAQIRPKRTFGYDPYRDILQACDLTTSGMMKAYRLESPLMCLPPLLLHMVDAKITEAEEREILPNTAKTYDDVALSHMHEHAFDYRSRDLLTSYAGELTQNNLRRDSKTKFLCPLPGNAMLYAIGTPMERPGKLFMRFEDGETVEMQKYDHVAVAGDRFLFLTSQNDNLFKALEMFDDHWREYAVVGYPEGLEERKISEMKPLSKTLLAVVFENKDCYLLDLSKAEDPWHQFHTIQSSLNFIDVYGTHEVPLLLLHTKKNLFIFDINSLIARNPKPRMNKLPHAETITCFTTIGDGVLATGHHDGQIRLWQFMVDSQEPKLKDTVGIIGLLGYDETYVPQQLCHLEDDNLAIRFYSDTQQNGIIMVLDPHNDHFIGKIPQSKIDDVDIMLPIPNGDLLIGNDRRLFTWSPTKRDQSVYESSQAIDQCYILAPEKIAVINRQLQLQLLQFPLKSQVLEAQKKAANDDSWVGRLLKATRSA